jgi:uncharacterized phage protein gp47/JayE
MPLEIKTLDELQSVARGTILGTVGGADVSPGSDYDLSSRMVAAVAEGQQAQADYVAKQIFVSSCDSESLAKHGEALGLFQTAAAKASGRVQITAASGTPLQTIGSLLDHADGTAYELTSAGAVSIPSWSGKTCGVGSSALRVVVAPDTTGMVAGDLLTIDSETRAIKSVLSAVGCVDLWEPLSAAPSGGDAISPARGAVASIAAKVANALGNKPVGDTLTLRSPASGAVTAAVRILELGGGGDLESEDDFRSRVRAAQAYRPSPGTPEYIRTLARQTPGVRVADAVVFPSFRMLGTFDVVILGVEGGRVVSTATADAVSAYIESKLPYSVQCFAEPLSYDSTERHVEITVAAEVGFEADFAGSFAIAGMPGSTTTRVYLTTPPDQIEIGDRVQLALKVGTTWGTYERAVTAKGLGSPYWIELDSPLPRAPLSTDPDVISGGPLVAPVVEAIEALLDRLGPSRHSGAFVFERHPHPTEEWDDAMRIGSLYESVMAVDGVNNMTIASPSADVVLTTPKVAIRRGRIRVSFVGVT